MYSYRFVQNDDVAPNAVENLAAMDGVASSLDEEDQQIEITGDQRELPTVADQQPLQCRKSEVTEPVARHGELNSSLGAWRPREVVCCWRQRSSCSVLRRSQGKYAYGLASAEQVVGLEWNGSVRFDAKGQVGISGALPYDTFMSVIKAFKARQ